MKAVANPPKLFWAPFLPAVANLAVQIPFMFIAIGLFHANPLIFLMTIIPVHAYLIVHGTREPHLSTMMKAFGPVAKKTHNIYKVRGNKFAP